MRSTLFLTIAAALVVSGLRAEKLTVEVRDGAGKLLPARAYLMGSDRTPYFPAGAPSYRRGPENHFLTPGRFEIDLKPDSYTLSIEKGHEVVPYTATIRIDSAKPRTVRVNLSRWISMNRRGWYSADLHNHRPIDDTPLILLAEDLNAVPVLADWVWEGKQRPGAVTSGEPIRPVDATHVYSAFDKEIERLGPGPGAIDLIGLKIPIPFNGDWLYPPNDVLAKQAREQGAWVDAEKIMWRDIPALAALGHIDFAGVVHNHFNRHGALLETDRWGMAPKHRPEYNTPRGMAEWTLEIYYHFLNCGFRLPVSAGSASGVMASPVGYNRVYAKLDQPFSYENLFRALKAGRSFATNGPMLFLTVNGHEPGATIERPQSLRVRVQAMPADSIERIEVIRNGVVERSAATSRLDLQLAAAEPGWIAARAFAKSAVTVRYAQTSPVYINLPGSPSRRPESARFFIDWIDREIAFYEKEPRFTEPAHRAAMIDLFRRARAVYSALIAK